MWYDLLCLGILTFFAIRGAMKGVVWQLAGIAGIILCFIFADGISAAAGPYVHLEPPLNHWAVLFGAYLVFSFVCFGLARGISSWIEKNKLKEFDSHLGAVFGLIKGVILCLVMTFLVVTVSQSARVALKSSHSGKAAAIIMDRLHPILPKKLHDALGEYIHLLDSDDLPLLHDHDHGQTHSGENDVLPTAPPGGVTLGTPGTLPASGTPATTIPNQSQPPATNFWGTVQNMLGIEAQRVVADAIRGTADPAQRSQLEQDMLKLLAGTDPAQRQQLQQQIVQVGAGQLDQYLKYRLATSPGSQSSPGTPVGPTPQTQVPSGSQTPAANAPGSTQRQTQLVKEIAAVFSTIPTVRLGIEQQVNQSLEGLPEPLRMSVLADWKADLWSEKPDPNPQTGPNSTVEQRILANMGQLGISLNQLSPALQQRLGQAQAPPRQGNPL